MNGCSSMVCDLYFDRKCLFMCPFWRQAGKVHNKSACIHVFFKLYDQSSVYLITRYLIQKCLPWTPVGPVTRSPERIY